MIISITYTHTTVGFYDDLFTYVYWRVDPCDCGVQVLLPEIAKRGLALLLILALQMAAELLLGLGG